MTDPDDLQAAPPAAGVTLERIDPGSPLIRETIVRIGTPYQWQVATWSAERWANWLASPARQAWIIRSGPEIAGLAEFEIQPGPTVEIATFGLVPEFVGKGIGGYALTLTLRQAWQTTPDVRRIWLHTSSFDNPAALPNYQKRGMRIFRTETKEVTH